MTLYLVRHGRAAAGIEHLDPGLDELGHAQARYTALALGQVRVERLLVSPLRRARETAAPIAETLGLVEEVRDEVAEVFDPTWAQEKRRALLGPLLGGRWSEQSPELLAWRDRVISTLLSLEGEEVVVVSHFVAISAAVGQAIEVDEVSPHALANASITTLRVSGARLELERAGDVSHLPPDAVTLAHTALAGQTR